MVALYRPMPMDNIPAYIRRKHGQEAVTYLPIRSSSRTSRRRTASSCTRRTSCPPPGAWGRFHRPRGGHPGLRHPQEEIVGPARQKERFVTRAAERGVSPAVIDAVSRRSNPSSGYGFNKAHATLYASASSPTRRCLQGQLHGRVHDQRADRGARHGQAGGGCGRGMPAARHRGAAAGCGALDLDFTVEGDAIRFGLQAVKNVGQGAMKSVIAARRDRRPVRSLHRPVLACRPAPGQPPRAGVAGQGGRA